MVKSVRFYPRFVAEQLNANPRIAFVSFYDNEEPPAQLKEGWGAVLRIKCHDIDVAKENCELFASSQATQILDLVKNLSPEFEQVYVHCSLGQSRSGGTALAIAEHLNVPCYKVSLPVDTFNYTIYNKHIYSLLTQAFNGVNVEDDSSQQDMYAKLFSAE